VSAALAVLAVVLATAGSSVASASKSTKVCKGTPTKPGVLTGTVSGNVVVKGVCEVKDGPATVKGSLTVASNSVFGAIFGHNDKTHKGVSNLTVKGNVTVAKGATAFLGCEAAHSPCLDDPNMKNPTLSNKVKIGGNLTSMGALAVIVHVTKIGGSVTQTGGGGGESCSSMPGIFAVIKSPVFSDYEDDSIGGSVRISGLSSCWLGALRDKVAKNFTLTNNAMADPDAMEIGSNMIKGNLACTGNTNAVPASAGVWDSHEANPNNGSFFPRIPVPNTVKGTRSGQCVTPPPLTMGGSPGAAGTF
jgi:hypothetical protein